MRLTSVVVAHLCAGIFVIGVGMAVYVLIRGVERQRERLPTHHGDRITIALFMPFAASLLVSFGAAGYALTRRGWPVDLVLFVAAALAVVVAIPATLLVRRWARSAASSDSLAGDDTVQGLVGVVIREAGPGRDAEVEYWRDDQRVVASARSADDATLHLGTEVVIERIDGSVVYVESWSQVEQRI